MARPKKDPGDKYTTPMRCIRMADEDWHTIQQAAKKQGQTTTEFIRQTMMRRARRVLK